MQEAAITGIQGGRWRRRFSIAFFLSTIGIAVIGFLAFYVLGRTTESEEWVLRTTVTIAALERFHQTLLAAESAGRAFLVTGERPFRESFDKQRGAIDNELRGIKEITADNKSQQDAAAVLDRLINGRFAILEGQMRVRASKGFEAMRQTSIGSGVLQMQATMAILDQMKETENRQLAERVGVRKRQNRLLKIVLASLIVAGVLTMAALFWAMSRLWKQRQQAEARVVHLAHHDTLTGLPNRRLLEDRMAVSIARAKRYKEMLGVLCLDLDGFKAVNDNYGHDAGDVLLQLVARRLQSVLRAEDTVARLGGDEFVVAFAHIADVEYAKLVADKIIQQLSMSYTVKGHEVVISTSIGIALYPINGATQESLLSQADKALYDAKRAGKRRYALATAGSDRQS